MDKKIVDMASNASCIRDTARVLGISTRKVLDTLKKGQTVSQFDPNYLELGAPLEGMPYEVVLYSGVENAELDELCGFVQNNGNQRWLWLAINHDNKEIIAYTFGRRQVKVFLAFEKNAGTPCTTRTIGTVTITSRTTDILSARKTLRQSSG